MQNLRLWKVALPILPGSVLVTFQIRKGIGQHLLESPLSANEQVVERDDDYEISAKVVDSARLEWWFRGFGSALKVLSKKPLVDDKKAPVLEITSEINKTQLKKSVCELPNNPN